LTIAGVADTHVAVPDIPDRIIAATAIHLGVQSLAGTDDSRLERRNDLVRIH
jgi:hypothetical protein